MNEETAGKLVLMIIGIAWSVIFYFAKRTLKGIDEKMERNMALLNTDYRELRRSMERRERLIARNLRAHYARLSKKAEKTVSSNNRSLHRLFVSRQEFGAFVANMNHKIDSIYESIKTEKPGVRG